MRPHPLFKPFILLCSLTAVVCLFFHYLLPMLLPFILAILFVRMLQHPIAFFEERLHMPHTLASIVSFTAFFGIILGTFLLLAWQLCRQFQLFLSNFPIYRQIYGGQLTGTLQNCCGSVDYYLGMESGTSYTFLSTQSASLTTTYVDTLFNGAGKLLASCFSQGVKLLTFALLLVVGMVTLSKEFLPLQEKFRANPHYHTFHSILSILKNSGISYLKTEFIIIIINFILSAAALFVIGNPYAVLLGLLISLADALPLLGTGLFFLPWGIYELLCKNFFHAAVLFTAYVATLFAREYLESRLLSAQMNIPAFFILLSIWVGLQFFGLLGIFLGPFAIVLIRTLYQSCTIPDIYDG